MKNIKPLFNQIPEIYMVLAIIFYWTMTGSLFNPIAITLIFVSILQILLKNKIMGSVIAILFIVLNLYMILALLSEFSEFPTYNSDAKKLIVFGLMFLGLNFTMAIFMLIKYIKLKIPNVQTSI